MYEDDARGSFAPRIHRATHASLGEDGEAYRQQNRRISIFNSRRQQHSSYPRRQEDDDASEGSEDVSIFRAESSSDDDDDDEDRDNPFDDDNSGSDHAESTEDGDEDGTEDGDDEEDDEDEDASEVGMDDESDDDESLTESCGSATDSEAASSGPDPVIDGRLTLPLSSSRDPFSDDFLFFAAAAAAAAEDAWEFPSQVKKSQLADLPLMTTYNGFYEMQGVGLDIHPVAMAHLITAFAYAALGGSMEKELLGKFQARVSFDEDRVKSFGTIVSRKKTKYNIIASSSFLSSYFSTSYFSSLP